jgi:hemerythrin-like domain-containing protein
MLRPIVPPFLVAPFYPTLGWNTRCAAAHSVTLDVSPNIPWGKPTTSHGDRWRARREGGQMDALQMLKEDHDKVKKLLSDLGQTTERGVKTRSELFAKVKQELQVHEAIEEEIFYPALKEHPKAKELVLEAYEEHNVVDMVMREIEGVPVEDETWGAKLTVMKENVEHHIEEEESEMFKQAKQVFGKDELDQLGERMQARKQQL